jgi:uncharacterized transporter YbjL
LAGYEVGIAAGLIAGSLTESATIGTAGDAISSLPISKDAQAHLANQIPVAFAVTYLVGMVACVWFLAQIAPRLLGVDLAAESVPTKKSPVVKGWTRSQHGGLLRSGPSASIQVQHWWENRSPKSNPSPKARVSM